MDVHSPYPAASTVDVPHAASAVSARNTDGMMRKKNRPNNLNVRHNLPAILFNSPLEKGDKGGCLLCALCPSIGLRAGFTRGLQIEPALSCRRQPLAATLPMPNNRNVIIKATPFLFSTSSAPCPNPSLQGRGKTFPPPCLRRE